MTELVRQEVKRHWVAEAGQAFEKHQAEVRTHQTQVNYLEAEACCLAQGNFQGKTHLLQVAVERHWEGESHSQEAGLLEERGSRLKLQVGSRSKGRLEGVGTVPQFLPVAAVLAANFPGFAFP